MQGQRKELLLQMLAESTDFLSGEKLAGELGISRAAVWKMIASLRQEGYCIEAVKKRGYLLRETDVLSAQQIRRALAKPWREIPDPGVRLHRFHKHAGQAAAFGRMAGGSHFDGAGADGRARAARAGFLFAAGQRHLYEPYFTPQLRVEESLLITSAAAVAVCRALRASSAESSASSGSTTSIGAARRCAVF
ncbi:MAG: biotin operon repressor [Christensenellaceae bacterium]